jgi:hypothetical protein
MIHERSPGTLGVLRDVRLTAEQAHVFQTLSTFDFGQIGHRLAKKAILPPEYIDPILLEFRRFLGMHAVSDDRPIMYSQTVDSVWHTCIQFTHCYAELCELAFGRFIHHRPDVAHEYPAMYASSAARQRFMAFRVMYERLFGPIDAVWLSGRPWASHRRTR